MNSPWSRSAVSRFAARRCPQSQPTSSPRAHAPPPNLPTATLQTSKETYLLSHNHGCMSTHRARCITHDHESESFQSSAPLRDHSLIHHALQI